jgi:hypothetical protein
MDAGYPLVGNSLCRTRIATELLGASPPDVYAPHLSLAPHVAVVFLILGPVSSASLSHRIEPSS